MIQRDPGTYYVDMHEGKDADGGGQKRSPTHRLDVVFSKQRDFSCRIEFVIVKVTEQRRNGQYFWKPEIKKEAIASHSTHLEGAEGLLASSVADGVLGGEYPGHAVYHFCWKYFWQHEDGLALLEKHVPDTAKYWRYLQVQVACHSARVEKHRTGGGDVFFDAWASKGRSRIPPKKALKFIELFKADEKHNDAIMSLDAAFRRRDPGSYGRNDECYKAVIDYAVTVLKEA